MSNLAKPEQPKPKPNAAVPVLIIILVVLAILVIVFLILWLVKSSLPGIGQSCSGSCATGLTCVSSICQCVKPSNPANFTQTIGTPSGNTTPVNLKWSQTNGADWYNLFILGPTPDIILEQKTTSVIVNLTSGNYTVHLYAVSSNCGFDDTNAGSTTSFTIP